MTAEGVHDWKQTKDKLWKCQICGRITYWKAALKNPCPGPKKVDIAGSCVVPLDNR